MDQAGSHKLLTMRAQISSQRRPCAICCGQNSTGTGFSPSMVGFPCHSIGAAYLYFHLPGALCSPNMNSINETTKKK
jgi:hypothetical protein